jgi:uncharacterized protein DUF6745
MGGVPGDGPGDLRSVRERWIGYGRCTDPADRPAAEAALESVYRAAGLPPPSRVSWVPSPLAGCRAAAELPVDPLREVLRDRVFAAATDREAATAEPSRRALVREEVTEPVWELIWQRVWTPLRDALREQAPQVQERAYHAGYGQQDAPRLAGYDALSTVDPQLAGLAELSRTAGWWWAYPDAAILSERPTALHVDDKGELHHDTGPAVSYPDGWALWAWHGIRVPQDLVERDDP